MCIFLTLLQWHVLLPLASAVCLCCHCCYRSSAAMAAVCCSIFCCCHCMSCCTCCWLLLHMLHILLQQLLLLLVLFRLSACDVDLLLRMLFLVIAIVCASCGHGCCRSGAVCAAALLQFACAVYGCCICCSFSIACAAATHSDATIAGTFAAVL